MDDPILERERILQVALSGKLPDVSAEQAEAGLQAAREYMKGGYAGRSPGFGIIHVWPERNDRQEMLVAVTDGTRAGAIMAWLTGTRVATLRAQGEDVIAHALGRLDSIAGAFPNAHRYEDMLAQHPVPL
jgi:Ser/Thr protein kinase RdoA (MazF antagonist)